MRRPRALQHQQKAHHGNRTVTQCLMYVDSFMEEGLSRQEAVKATSKLFNIAKSNIRRWWIFYDKYGETHIIVSKKLQQLRKRYGSTRVSMNDNTIHELQRIVDAHPEYYLDELVASVARVCGVLYHPSTISRVLRRKLGYSLQVLQEVATQRNELLRESYRSALRHLLKNGHSVSSLVFIDETHKDRSASRRRRGWGKRNSGGLLIIGMIYALLLHHASYTSANFLVIFFIYIACYTLIFNVIYASIFSCISYIVILKLQL